MKKGLILSLICASALFGGIHETNDGRFLQLYADNDPQSTILAEVPAESKGLRTLKCRSPKDGITWCKVRYEHDGVRLTGWIDKKSLDTIAAIPNKSPYFEKRFGGRYEEVGKDIVVLKDGFIIAGSTASFGEGQHDGYVVRTDRFGNKIWSHAYGGRYEDELEAIMPWKNGFIVAGATRSIGNKVQSIYAARIRANGDLMWQNGYYNDDDDRYGAKALAKVNDSHIMVAGFEDHIKFFNSEVNCYLIALEDNGLHKWQAYYGGEDKEMANSIVAVDDGYVFAGVTDTWGHGDEDMYVVRVDKSGKRLWHNAFGYDDKEVANQIIATRDGGFLAVGTTDSDRRKMDDVYVVKMDANGKRQWQHHYGGEYDEEGLAVTEADNGYVIAGFTESTKNHDMQVYLLKIDFDGNIFWQRTYGGPDDDAAYAIKTTSDGFVVTGYSEGNTDKGKDLYLLKVDKNGKL